MIAIGNRRPRNDGGPGSAGGAASVGRGIFRATMLVVLAGVLTKLLGAVRNPVIGAWFGSGHTTDCFLAAFSLLSAVYYVGEECLGPAFLPVYMERRERDGPAAAWRLASTVLNLQFLALVTAVSVLAAFAPRIVERATRWQLVDELGKASANLDLTSRFLAWMAPALFGLSLATMTFMLLNARKKFFWASMGEGSLRAASIAAVVALGSGRFLGVWALPAGVLAGSVAKLCTHLPGLRAELRLWRPRLDLSGPDFRRFALLIAPLLAGSVFAKLRDVFNNVYVASAAEMPGTISSIFFGRSVVDTLNVLVPYSLSVGMFPYLCELADRGDRGALGEVLDRSSRFMVFLFLPAAALLVVAAAPMTGFLFAFGNLTPEAAGLIGIVTACSAPAMPFYCLERVMMKGFFSTRRTLEPTVIGIATSVLSMAACYYLVIVRGFKGADALVVLSLTAVAQRGLKVLLLVLFLRPRLPIFALRPSAVFALKVLVLTAAVAGAAWGAHRGLGLWLPDWKSLGVLKGKLMLGADLAAISAAGGITFLAGARLLRMEEFALAAAFVRPRAAALLARVRRRR